MKCKKINRFLLYSKLNSAESIAFTECMNEYSEHERKRVCNLNLPYGYTKVVSIFAHLSNKTFIQMSAYINIYDELNHEPIDNINDKGVCVKFDPVINLYKNRDQWFLARHLDRVNSCYKPVLN